MTFTTQVHPAGACTTICCAPVDVSAVTFWPDAPVSETAAGGAGAAPDATTKISNEGPDAGGGLH